MPAFIVTMVSISLSAVFAASVFAKATAWDGTVDWFAELWPNLRPQAAAVVVVAGEAVVMLLAVTGGRVGGLAAFVWIAAASLALVAARKRLSDCGCFGRRQPLGRAVVARNALLLCSAAVIAVWGAADLLMRGAEAVFLAVLIGMSAVVARDIVDGQAAWE